MKKSLIAAIVAVTTCSALADVTMVFDTTDESQQAATLQVSGTKLRMSSDDGGIIFNRDSGEFLMLDHQNQRYTRMTQADLAKLGDVVNTAMAAMESQLQGLPAAQRDQIRQMMEQQMGSMMASAPKPVITKTGNRDEIAGYRCEEYQVMLDDQLVSRHCVASLADLGISGAEQQTMEAMWGTLEDLLANLPGGGADMTFFAGDGAPVRYTNFDNGQITDSGELQRIDDSAIDAAVFAAPANYTEQRMELPEF